MGAMCRRAVCLVAAALWSGPAFPQDPGEGTLRIAASTVPGVLGNPYPTIGATTSTAWGVIFDTLTMFDSDGRLQPGLALSWSQRDVKTWTFHLRDGATFHNGVPFTAETIVRNIEYLLSKTMMVCHNFLVEIARSLVLIS